jgi:pimeloyl-ACP methyl ester carboxylesterase
MKIATLMFLFAACVAAASSDAPPPEAFRVLPPVTAEAPTITDYLRYQTDVAWRQDDERRNSWAEIQTEQELRRVQEKLRQSLLTMLGGLPTAKTPLNPHITGRIPMDGFHIEKLIFESVPGFYVTAAVYVPEDESKKHPAVLVPAGHSSNGKAYYQALCQRLVKHGYVVISWDPVGQGERSQFWDAKNHKSRYNLICAEHAIMGNLAYLAGTNLARWEIWDGIRAVDYLITRSDVDPERINITGTSGGGTQTAYIAALDPRIKVAAPSCFITALPMRVYNRIFKDPDSDPEQDLYGMLSNGVDHAGLLLLMYPRPVFVAAAVLDFFPIEGTYKTWHEIADFYGRFGHADRISMHESYNGHQYSPENQEAAIDFLDHFNGMRALHEISPIKELAEKELQVTQSGQVMTDFENAKSVMDLVHEYYEKHKSGSKPGLKQMYYSRLYPRIQSWRLTEYRGAVPLPDEISSELKGSTRAGDMIVDRYLLHHSRFLQMPLLWIHKGGAASSRRTLLWLGDIGKATERDWPQLTKYLDDGYDVVSFDPRGLGETRMPYKAASPDDPALAQMNFEQAYFSPISGVLGDYVYNSLLTGRPYFLQMIEDVEIAARFIRAKAGPASEIAITGSGNGYSLASAASETLPGIRMIPQPESEIVKWSDLVEEKRELWPIQDLLPGGAYIH